MLFRTPTAFEYLLLVIVVLLMLTLAIFCIVIIPGDFYKWAGIVTVTILIMCLYITLFTMFIRRRIDPGSSRDHDETETGRSRLPLGNFLGGATPLIALFGLYFAICGLFTLEYIALAQLNDPLYCATCNGAQVTSWDAMYYSFVTPFTLGSEFVPRGLFARFLTVLEVVFAPIFVVMLLLQLRSPAIHIGDQPST